MLCEVSRNAANDHYVPFQVSRNAPNEHYVPLQVSRNAPNEHYVPFQVSRYAMYVSPWHATHVMAGLINGGEIVIASNPSRLSNRYVDLCRR